MLPQVNNQAFKPAEMGDFSDKDPSEKLLGIPSALNQNLKPVLKENTEGSVNFLNDIPPAKNQTFQPANSILTSGNESQHFVSGGIDSVHMLRILPRVNNQAFKPAEIIDFSDENPSEKLQEIPMAVKQDLKPDLKENRDGSVKLSNGIPPAKNQPFQPANSILPSNRSVNGLTNQLFQPTGINQISQRDDGENELYKMTSMKTKQVFKPAFDRFKTSNSEKLLGDVHNLHNRKFEPAYSEDSGAVPNVDILRKMPHARNQDFQPASVTDNLTDSSDISGVLEKIPPAKNQSFQPANILVPFQDTFAFVATSPPRPKRFEPSSPTRSSELFSNIPKARKRKFRPAVPGDGRKSTTQTGIQGGESEADDFMRLIDSVPRTSGSFRASNVIMTDPYSPALRPEWKSRLASKPVKPLKPSQRKFKALKPKRKLKFDNI